MDTCSFFSKIAVRLKSPYLQKIAAIRKRPTNAIACRTSIRRFKRADYQLIDQLNVVPIFFYLLDRSTVPIQHSLFALSLCGALVCAAYSSLLVLHQHSVLGSDLDGKLEASTHILLRDTVRNSPYDVDKLPFCRMFTSTLHVLRMHRQSILGCL